MPQKYTTKSGRVMVFPDDATPEEIQSAVDSEEGVAAPTAGPDGFSLGGLAKAVGKGVVAGIGGAPAKFIYDQAKSIYNDPVQYISDAGAQLGAMAGGAALGTLGGPVGTVAGGIGGAMLGGGGGQAIENMIRARPVGEGVMTEGAVQGAVQSIPVAGKPLIKAGTALYRKTLAPVASDLAKVAKNSTMPALDAAANKLAETGIRYRLPITRGGVRKADAIVTRLDDSGRTLVADAAKAGATVNPADVRRDAYKYLREKFGPQAQTFSETDMAAARSKTAEFSRNPTVSETAIDPTTGMPYRKLKDSAPVDEMDALRRGTMRGVRNKYGQKINDAGTEAEKAFGHAEREAVTRSVDATVPAGQPNLSALRAEEKDLLDLSKSLVRRQTNAANSNLFRLYEFLGMLSGNPAAIGLGTFSRPGVMSRAAIGMTDVGRHAGAINPALVRAALAARLGQNQPE